MMEENCQKLAEQANYSEAYMLWIQASKGIRNVQLLSHPGLKKIKNFITTDLVNRNCFERVCNEIDELDANEVRDQIIGEIVKVYFENKDLEYGNELLKKYNIKLLDESEVKPKYKGGQIYDIPAPELILPLPVIPEALPEIMNYKSNPNFEIHHLEWK